MQGITHLPLLRIGYFFFSPKPQASLDFREKKKHKPFRYLCFNHQVIPFGFEPKTYCLEGSCSIQLSYGTEKKTGQ
jgi:hypothetical protein